MIKSKKDFFSGTALFLFCIVLYFLIIPKWVAVTTTVGGVNSRTFPEFSTIFIGLLSFFLIIKSFLFYSSDTEEPEESKTKDKKPFAPYSIIFIMVLYTFIVPHLGYLITTILSMIIIMGILSVRKWYYYLIVILIIISTVFLFEDLLRVQLP